MFGNFSHAFDRLLSIQKALEAAMKSDYFETATTGRGSYPPVNLFQEDDNVVLTTELPGLKKEDIKIEVKDNLIRVSGKRSIKYPEKAGVHRLERKSRSFDRVLRLPAKVDEDRIKAEYKNGVLTAVLPRAEKDKPKLINVA